MQCFWQLCYLFPLRLEIHITGNRANYVKTGRHPQNRKQITIIGRSSHSHSQHALNVEKYGHVVSEICERTNNKQTDTVITILLTPIGEKSSSMYHSLRSCVSRVLTANALVNEHPPFSTPHRIDVP